MRTIEWIDEFDQARMIDQRKLPARFEYLKVENAAQMAAAIREMVIRGAPALGVAGAFGIALEVARNRDLKSGDLKSRLRNAAAELIDARPTAVNLAWGVNRMLGMVEDEAVTGDELVSRLSLAARELAEEDVRTNLKMAEHGASLIEDEDTIIHHCNTGSLAAVDWGTALGAIRYAHEHGKRVYILVDETRPRLQGVRLTAWECEQYGIPYDIISDNMAGYFLRSGKVQKVFFGADRVAANGDVVNKIGTYMLSLAAYANHVPVVCVFPLSTLDHSVATGDQIPIEFRDPAEVLNLSVHGEPVAPTSASALNPAFDVTPHHLISDWVTEAGVIHPPFGENLSR
jgi:methylthioribose-1-phosphate isomerase